MNITNTYTIEIETKADGFVTRPMKIVLTQDFNVEIVRNSFAREVEWTAETDIAVSVMAGDFELFNGDVSDLGGWMGRSVAFEVEKGIDWDIKDADALEMLRNEQDQEATEASLMPGRI